MERGNTSLDVLCNLTYSVRLNVVVQARCLPMSRRRPTEYRGNLWRRAPPASAPVTDRLDHSDVRTMYYLFSIKLIFHRSCALCDTGVDFSVQTFTVKHTPKQYTGASTHSCAVWKLHSFIQISICCDRRHTTTIQTV